MESRGDFERNPILPKSVPLVPIDPKRARYPCCIVWTSLPVISWFIPFIGHVGICREDGVILDFAGPNFVCVDHFTFGSPARYIQLDREKAARQEDNRRTTSGEILGWDDSLMKSTQEFQHRSYNLFTCNCHSFVANNLNRLCYDGREDWNVVNLASWVFFRGTWVSVRALVRSFFSFIAVFCIGLLLGGSTFLTGWLLISLALVCWFVFGTYCMKNVVQL